jgi:hypothetical protein
MTDGTVLPLVIVGIGLLATVHHGMAVFVFAALAGALLAD